MSISCLNLIYYLFIILFSFYLITILLIIWSTKCQSIVEKYQSQVPRAYLQMFLFCPTTKRYSVYKIRQRKAENIYIREALTSEFLLAK